MSTRVSPIRRVGADIDELFASDRDLGEVLEEMARLGVRLLLQAAVEPEVTEFLGRERFAHGERGWPGSRNGHCPTTVKTTAGPVRIEAGFLTAMAGRGQRGPTLVISDGAPGLLAAVESVFPHGLTQLCLIRRAHATWWPRCPSTAKRKSRLPS